MESRNHTQGRLKRDHCLLKVVVVGAGIGGLACAIACRRANPPLAVTVVERAPEILTIGAGIHIPPNACRIVTHLGLLEELKQAKAYSVEGFTLRRYKDGNVIVEKPMGERMEREYGAEWLAIHRGDYQNVLLEAARKNGAKIITNGEVTGIEQGTGEDLGKQIVLMKDGNRMMADIVVGADGLWSGIREYVLGRPMPPVETGDLAYRGTFTREQLKGFRNEKIDKLIEASNVQVWLGSGRHAVFYPLRDKTEYNLVLLCADNLPEGVRASQGSLEEMAANFEGWDPTLNTIISCLKSALKWKLLHFKELDQWTKGPVALLGDASHPTLPYQARGPRWLSKTVPSWDSFSPGCRIVVFRPSPRRGAHS
ncbi:FAD binding domain-containing protein [Cladophialophora immunda]|nr:FAD binding domain-containing protein [Cladophialophora immunda]